MIKRTLALSAAGALLAAPAVLLVASPASADVERNGACGAGRYEFNVDRDDRRFEVSTDLDNLPAGSTWKVVMRQDGNVIAKVTRKADREGDIEVERNRPNTAGKDTFKLAVKRVGGSATCGATITVR